MQVVDSLQKNTLAEFEMSSFLAKHGKGLFTLAHNPDGFQEVDQIMGLPHWLPGLN